jgi:cell division control protein 45
MLTSIFRYHNIAYTIRSVANFAQVRHNFNEIRQVESIRTVFLINCGAAYDIPKDFGLEGHSTIRCIVIDNHRPIHLKNIHSRDNVVVFDDAHSMAKDAEKNEIPSSGTDIDDFESSENDESSSEEEESDDEGGSNPDSVPDEEAIGEEDPDAEFQMDMNEGAPLLAAERQEEAAGADADDEADADSEADAEFEVGEGDDRGEDKEANAGAESSVASVASGGALDTSNDNDTSLEDRDEDGEGPGDGEKDGEKDQGEEGAEQEEEEEEEKEEEGEEEPDDVGNIVGRRRRALDEKYDPVRIRRRRIRNYLRRWPSYGTPTSLLMTFIAQVCRMALTHDFYWQAVLGVTDQYHRGNISEATYNDACAILRQKLGTQANVRTKYYVNNSDEATVTARGIEAGRVEHCLDYRFFLFRHWSLYDAMYFSPYVGSKLAVWKTQGANRLQEMLAKLGMPLHDCKQSYGFMSPELRDSFKNLVTETSVTERYNLKNPGVLFNSFLRYNSFRNPFSASDVVHAATALVELCQHEVSLLKDEDGNELTDGVAHTSQLDAFNEAYDMLGMRSDQLLKKGITTAQALQKTIVRQSASMLDSPDMVVDANHFRYAIINRAPGQVAARSVDASSSGSIAGRTTGASDSSHDHVEVPLSRPMVLKRLGIFLQEVQRENGRWTRDRAKPLVLASERGDQYLVIGIPCSALALNPPAPPRAAADIAAADADAEANGGLPIAPAPVEVLTESTNFNFSREFRRAATDIDAAFRYDAFDSCCVEISKDDTQHFIEKLYNNMEDEI